MLACAKAQPGVEQHDRLSGPRAALAPSRLNQQRRANFDGLEMTLPGLGPVFPAHFSQGNPGGTDLHTTGVDSLNPPSEPRAGPGIPCGLFLEENRDPRVPSSNARVRSNWLAERSG